MRARVELRDSLSHGRPGGRTFKRNEAQILTDPEEIAYYRTNSAFSVVMLDESKKSKAKSVALAQEEVEEDLSITDEAIDEALEADESQNDEEVVEAELPLKSPTRVKAKTHVSARR